MIQIDINIFAIYLTEVEAFDPWELDNFSESDLWEGSEINVEKEMHADQFHKQSRSASTEEGLIHKKPFCPSSRGKPRWNPIINSDSEDQGGGKRKGE